MIRYFEGSKKKRVEGIFYFGRGALFSSSQWTLIKMQLLLMEGHRRETRVQAPVLLRCVVAADMQVILRGGLPFFFYFFCLFLSRSLLFSIETARLYTFKSISIFFLCVRLSLHAPRWTSPLMSSSAVQRCQSASSRSTFSPPRPIRIYR